MSKALVSGKILAIQLGRDQTQIALVGASSGILHSVSLPTPSGAVEDGTIKNQEVVRTMLKKALEDNIFHATRKVVFCLSTSQVITETVAVPDLPAQKMEKLLLANADMYFPVDMKDYKMVWQPIGLKNKDSSMQEMMVQLWAVPTAVIAKYYAVANACGLSVEAIDFVGNSIANAVGASFSAPSGRAKKKLSLNMELSFGKKKTEAPAPAPEGDEPKSAVDTDVYVSLDSDLMGMTFVQNGQVVMQRFVRCGAEPITQLDELSMMVEYFRSLDVGRGSNLYVNALGALSDDRDLLSALTDLLDMSVIRFAQEKDPRWVLCAAAAHTDKDFGNASLNRAKAARKQVGAELWQYVLVLACGAVLVGVILLTLSSRLIWNAEIKGLEAQQQALTIQAQKSAGYAENYKTYESLYENYSSDWDTVFAATRTYNNNLVLVLKELEEILPKTSCVLQLQIGMDGMNVTFASEDKEEAAYLIMALRELKYANLVAISNLEGGGKGPATSYGPDKTNKNDVEQAPTEGSVALAAEGNQSSIASLISKELDQDELMALALTMTPEQFALLEKAYGKQPETKYPSLAQMKNDPNVSPSFTQRSDAVEEMFTNNPFAVNHFVDILEKDLERDEPILYWIVLEELIILEEEGKLPAGSMDSAEDMQAYADVLVYILTKNETNLTAAETLFATDKYLESTYIHYLEVEMSLRPAETLPFLNLENVVKDMMDGSFNTGDSALDTKLNGLVSQDAWNMMDQMNSEEEMEALLTKYLTNGTTGNPAMDALINEYLTEGTTGSAYLDGIIQEKLGNQYLESELGKMMQDYLATGTTGNKAVDEMIAAYLTTGTTGNPQMDKIIKDYLGEGQLDDQMAKLFEKYLADGTTGNTVMDKLIKKFLTTGTTGNGQLDNMIQDCIASGDMEDAIGALVNKYLAEGTTGNDVMDGLIQKFFNTGSTGNVLLDDLITDYLNGGKADNLLAGLIQNYFNDGTTGVDALDSLIEKYLTTGTTGNKQLDKIIINYINGGYLDAKMAELLKKYLANGTTGNPVLDELIKKYTKTGSTGNPQLDKLIKNYLGGGNSNIWDDFLNNWGSGTGMGTGTGTGVGGGAQDTRIRFTVALSYKEDLIQEELVRKGLDQNAKIGKLEVAG